VELTSLHRRLGAWLNSGQQAGTRSEQKFYAAPWVGL